MKTVFPEDLTSLSIEELDALRVSGLEEFDTLWKDDFASIPDEDSKTLASLTEGLTKVTDELGARQATADKFAAMKGDRDKFATITINSGTLSADIEDSGADSGADATVTPGVADDSSTITAASDRDSEATAGFATDTAAADAEPKAVAYATGEGLGLPIDAPMDWDKLGSALDRRLGNFNVTPYANAAKSGRPLKTIQSFAAFKREIPEDRMIREGASKGVIRKAIESARDQTKLPGGSLIASGGWGAPSDISYDRFPKLSSQEGLATFPTIGIEHGGLQMPHGSTFASVYASPDYIAFTEQQDIDGDYEPGSGGNVSGPKPVYRIPPTEWVDYRLQVDGIHIQAGILENRGYPQGISEEVAQVMDAHEHLINAKKIAKAVSGSTAINFTAAQLGSVAPVLAAVEVQVLHYRDTHRMPLLATLEAKFPHWIKGAFRADLSRRLGVALLDVTDADINAWFTLRGISLEYVYDWQSIAGTAATAQLAFPTHVSFLLYSAGTWVEGTSDVISLDTMYDSTLLGTNDYTVLFTEQGWFLAKAGPDSRVITVQISSDGTTNIGAELLNDGATS
jgi:hypothetical protein